MGLPLGLPSPAFLFSVILKVLRPGRGWEDMKFLTNFSSQPTLCGSSHYYRPLDDSCPETVDQWQPPSPRLLGISCLRPAESRRAQEASRVSVRTGSIALADKELSKDPWDDQKDGKMWGWLRPAHLGCNYLIFLENQHHQDEYLADFRAD